MDNDAFKIWKNPSSAEEVTIYMGEFYPPKDQVCFFSPDLRELGFAPGHYTIKVPDSLRKVYVLPPWQQIILP
jgi:hypothetical protein